MATTFSTIPRSPPPERPAAMRRSIFEDDPPAPTTQPIQPRSADPSQSNCMRVALVLNLLVVTGLLAYFALYTAGSIPLENFTGMIGSSVFLTTSSILFLLSTALLVLNYRK